MLIRNHHRPDERRGIVLLAVLVVVVLLSLAAYQYSDMMLSEYKAVVNAHRAAQARAFADSGIHYAAALLRSPESIAALGGNIYDNPDAFRDIAIAGEDKGSAGRFSFIAPYDAEAGSSSDWRFGFTDEAAKINVNAFMKRDPSGQQLHDALMKLPNMTEDLASSIVDWLDSDSTTRPGGAENDYYSAEGLPYRAKNGPIDSIGELMLVKGMTRDILYGNDYNGNGIQDGDEGTTSAEGFTRGLSAYLTVYSHERNADAQGQALTFVNETDLAAFYEKLSAPESVGEDLAKFIVMYRQYGPSNSTGQQQSLGGSIAAIFGGGKSSKTTATRTIKGNLEAWTPDLNKKGNQKITSFFDLVNAQVSIPGKTNKDAKGGQQPPATVYDSPLKDAVKRRDLMPKLFEHVTIFEESDIPARINVNTAPREVLLAIPEMTETDVEAIVRLRPNHGDSVAPAAIFNTPAWLLTEANLKTDTLKKLEKYVTTKTQVYRVQALGYADSAGPAARIEAVIDVNGDRPRILMWRDLTELGASRPAPP